MKGRYLWLASEKSVVKRMYESGSSLRDISAEIGCSEDAIRRAVGRWKFHRPEDHDEGSVRANSAWNRVRAVLNQKGQLTIAEICEETGIFKSIVLRVIKDHRDNLYISRWKPTTRRPAAIWALGESLDAPKPVRVRRRKCQSTPFATAAGMIRAPQGITGRIVRRMLDDDMEAA